CNYLAFIWSPKQVRLARPADLDDAIVQVTVLYTTSLPKPEPMEIGVIYTALNAVLRNNSTTFSANRLRNNSNDQLFNTSAGPSQVQFRRDSNVGRCDSGPTPMEIDTISCFNCRGDHRAADCKKPTICH
ncbi:hypothetical protein BGX30_007162, partial [Mortierella sp. GBA39]